MKNHTLSILFLTATQLVRGGICWRRQVFVAQMLHKVKVVVAIEAAQLTSQHAG